MAAAQTEERDHHLDPVRGPEGRGFTGGRAVLDFGGLKLAYIWYDVSDKPAGQGSADGTDGAVIRSSYRDVSY